MSPQSSALRGKSQIDSASCGNFSDRLREERLRVAPHQGRFAARIGISQNRQSSFETGSRELRAEYLAAIAEAGLDVHYILTGERNDAAPIGRKASELLTHFLGLPAPTQETILNLAQSLHEQLAGRAVIASASGDDQQTLHDRQLDYRGS